ncbi:MAG: hypothetical protein JG718_11355 [Candidatus Thiothrix moscowensis]|nr:hypothetical protein [Candidatus Thiothrix moscowensis]
MKKSIAHDEASKARLSEEDEAWEKNQKILRMLAGIGSGPVDASVNYKEYIYEYLREKHGLKQSSDN